MKPLSTPAIRILNAAIDFRREHGYAASHRELRDLSGVSSTSVVAYHLQRLRDDGYLTFRNGQSRTIVVLLDENGEEV